MHVCGEVNHSGPQTWNQHIWLSCQKRIWSFITNPFRGCCHGNLQEKVGVGHGGGLERQERGASLGGRSRGGKGEGWTREGGKEQTLWKNGTLNEGVDAGDGADGVQPPLPPHTPGGNSHSETTLTRCGQQLFSCCSCLVCSPLQYVWCARCRCSHLYPALVWHLDIHGELLWVKK